MNPHHHPFHNFPALPPFDGGNNSAGDDIMHTIPTGFHVPPFFNQNDNNNNNNIGLSAAVRESDGAGLFEGYHQQQQVEANFVSSTVTADDSLSFSFKDKDMMNEFGGLEDYPPWNQNFNSPQSCKSGTVESPWNPNFNSPQSCMSGAINSLSPMNAGSPTSTLLTHKAGDNQGSGSSEDEDAELEASPCDQTNNPDDDVKRIRRMQSNRESARRSRRRKQAELQDLESQVEELSGENVSLFQQLGDAARQLREATTNNRVLKADVAALRAKVRLAQVRVTRGTMSPALNHILQTQLSSPPQMLNPQGLSRVSPTIGFQGQDDASFGGGLSSIIANSVGDHVLNGNAESPAGIVGSTTIDAMSSCIAEMWP